MRCLRVLLLMILLLTVCMAPWQPQEAPAAAVINLAFTETDTLYVPRGFTFLSIRAVGDTIGVRILGGPYTGLPDSIPVPMGEHFNVNLATRQFTNLSSWATATGVAVYLGEGASATGVAW